MTVPYSNMSSKELLQRARMNLRTNRYQNVARALRILHARFPTLNNTDRIQLKNLANRASKMY